jgi:hypothetical protein
VLSQFVGGMPPAIFLFLTGVTLAFLMISSDRKGLTAREKLAKAASRSAFLFGIAFAFRLQMWIFAWPGNPWTEIFKVDILNCMGLAILTLSPLALIAARQRARMAALAGLAIAAVSPLMSAIDWTGAPWLLRNYLRPDYNFFAYFPWASFLAFGVSAGTILKRLAADHIDRAMQWAAIVGAVLVLSAQYFSSLPYSIYRSSEFWLDSPALIFIKLGVIIVMIALAYLWTRHVVGERWSWVAQFGTTSLLVYWVHIELVYGRWTWFLKESLNVGQTLVSAVILILLMLLLSTARTNWGRWKAGMQEMGWNPFAASRRVAGGD